MWLRPYLWVRCRRQCCPDSVLSFVNNLYASGMLGYRMLDCRTILKVLELSLPIVSHHANNNFQCYISILRVMIMLLIWCCVDVQVCVYDNKLAFPHIARETDHKGDNISAILLRWPNCNRELQSSSPVQDSSSDSFKYCLRIDQPPLTSLHHDLSALPQPP